MLDMSLAFGAAEGGKGCRIWITKSSTMHERHLGLHSDSDSVSLFLAG